MAFDSFKNAFYGPFRFGEATMPPDRFEGHTGDSVRQKSDPQARNPILSAKTKASLFAVLQSADKAAIYAPIRHE